jgi:predicted alpha/beta superfamily hydrolase
MSVLGSIQRFQNFTSRFVPARHVDVWCPPGYDESDESYPVLYMHDGQNLFAPLSSISGESWGMDDAIVHLMDTKKIRGALVVGIWNTDLRWREYMPQKPYWTLALQRHHEAFVARAGGDPISDAYLAFLVEELKPFVDSKFRTLADRQNTFVMGSSMGGLISLYAISQYPDVFHGAGCLSTNWPAGEHELVNEMAKILPAPASHKLYFDYGTEGLDALYEPYQSQMDKHLQEAGYVENENWITRKFEGAAHNEAAWRDRVEIPLSFLLSQTN